MRKIIIRNCRGTKKKYMSPWTAFMGSGCLTYFIATELYIYGDFFSLINGNVLVLV